MVVAWRSNAPSSCPSYTPPRAPGESKENVGPVSYAEGVPRRAGVWLGFAHLDNHRNLTGIRRIGLGSDVTFPEFAAFDKAARSRKLPPGA